MGRAINYVDSRAVLHCLFDDAEADSRGKQIPKVARRVEEAAEMLFGSNVQSYREALVGCAPARILDEEIDINPLKT